MVALLHKSNGGKWFNLSDGGIASQWLYLMGGEDVNPQHVPIC